MAKWPTAAVRPKVLLYPGAAQDVG